MFCFFFVLGALVYLKHFFSSFLFTHSILWFQKSVPCELCKEVLTVVGQVLKENATEVRPKDPQLVFFCFFFI